MPKPEYVTDQDIERWDNMINEDNGLPEGLKEITEIREVCRAGLFLAEELTKLGCPYDLLVRIQFTAGKMSFDNDVWDIHQQFVTGYKDGKLDFEMAENEDELN